MNELAFNLIPQPFTHIKEPSWWFFNKSFICLGMKKKYQLPLHFSQEDVFKVMNLLNIAYAEGFKNTDQSNQCPISPFYAVIDTNIIYYNETIVSNILMSEKEATQIADWLNIAYRLGMASTI